MTEKGFSSVLFIVIITAVLIAGYFAYNRTNKTSTTPPPKQQACTQDAKLCPDGTSVGRVGPKCDFSPCPLSPVASAKGDTLKESTSSTDTTNWRTYTYEDPLNIFFKYPNSFAWLIDLSESATQPYIAVKNSKDQIKISIEEWRNPDWTVQQGHGSTKTLTQLKEELGQEKNTFSLKNHREIRINEHDVLLGDIKYYNRTYSNFRAYVLDGEGKVIVITLETQKGKEFYDQILSTLKFLP